MFDIAPTELLLCALVALVVIGPKDLPKAMRVVGHWVGRARGMARQFRSGFDAMVREAELDEMEKKWAAENERIMREHPPESPAPDTDMSVTAPPADPVAPMHPAALTNPVSPVESPADPVPPAPPVADTVTPPPEPAEAPKPAGQLDLGLGGAPTDPKS
jgi:sec-independent protein translocase protein TatB